MTTFLYNQVVYIRSGNTAVLGLVCLSVCLSGPASAGLCVGLRLYDVMQFMWEQPFWAG